MNKPSTTAAPMFPTVAKPKRRNVEVDPDLLVIEHGTPMPKMRSSSSDKYGPTFSKLKQGSCIRCETREVSTIANALGKALKENKYPELIGCKVLSRRRCEDGHGRIWVIPAEK